MSDNLQPIQNSSPVAGNRVRQPWENQPCPTCRVNKVSKRCEGHGGNVGGGGSDSEEQAAKAITQTVADVPSKIIETESKTSTRQFRLNENTFDSEITPELLKKLLITNDRELGILTIKLRWDYQSLSPEERNELKNLFDFILKELDKFQEEKRISAKCDIKKDVEGNIQSIRIMLPTPTMYDAFILRLTGPTPYANKNLNLAAKEEEASYKRIRPASPLDGCKPSGCK